MRLVRGRALVLSFEIWIGPCQGSTLGDGTGTWNLVTVCNDLNGRQESTEPEPGTWNPKPGTSE